VAAEVGQAIRQLCAWVEENIEETVAAATVINSKRFENSDRRRILKICHSAADPLLHFLQ
jgi:hypothetical protein